MDTTDPIERDRIVRAAGGDEVAWKQLVDAYHPRLWRMVALRLDPRLQGRVDAADVLQEVYLEAHGRLADYCANSTVPFFLWLRLITGDKIARLHRFHIATQLRDAGREISIFGHAGPEASSTYLANHLLGGESGPSEKAEKNERRRLLEEALNELDPLDREVLALRHYEQLASPEAAQVLGITPAAAAKRYFRAVQRLKEILSSRPGGLEGFLP
jgi:RNA polymerase sigma-70 factor, ECF subfamily